MPFTYPTLAHVRRHAPAGYTVYSRFKPWLRDEFSFRCVFCYLRECFFPSGQDSFSVEHLLPQVARPDLACEYGNLVLACLKCNSFKGDRWPVPDPCVTGFGTLLAVAQDGSIRALTDDGRVLVRLLRLDREDLTIWRRRFLALARALPNIDPASELSPEWRAAFGYPQNMPDLRRYRAPVNGTPHSAGDCHFARLERGELPDSY